MLNTEARQTPRQTMGNIVTMTMKRSTRRRMKHALLNTTPDITKKIMVGDKEVKVRDTKAIQMANAKIDEIRNGFTDWLNEQSDEFKERLEKTL